MSRLAILGALLLFGNLFSPLGANVPLKASAPKTITSKTTPKQPSEADLAAFSQVEDLYRDGKFEEATALLNELRQSTADQFRLHSYLAVVLAKTKTLIYPLAEARAAVKLNSRNAVTNCNLGILLQRNGERGAAVEKYRSAITIDSLDWRPHVGIAQCLSIDGADGRVIAERELKLAAQTPSRVGDALKWASLGATYLTMEMRPDAGNCYVRAIAMEPGNYAVKLGRLKSALASNNLKVIKELAPEIITDNLIDQTAVLALALPASQLSTTQLSQLEKIAERNFVSEKFFYQLGRNFESGGNLDLAEKSYLQAISFSGAASQYVLALVGNRAASGNLDAAKQLVIQYGTNNKLKAHHHKDVFAQALAYAGQLLANGDQPSSLHILNVVFSNIKCGCRIPVIEMQLRALPGVIFAHLQDAKDPPACIVYDAKVTTSKTITDIKREQDKVEVISDHPVKSLPELVKMLQTAADPPDKHFFTLWSFEPPPMELPK